MTQLIDLDTSVSAGGTVTSNPHAVNASTCTIQSEITGATTDTSVFLEARLSNGMPWATLQSNENVTNGFTGISIVDILGIHSLRARVVNNDGTNAGNAHIIVTTD